MAAIADPTTCGLGVWVHDDIEIGTGCVWGAGPSICFSESFPERRFMNASTTSETLPAYPTTAFDKDAQGTVAIEFCVIGTAPRPSVEIVASSGSAELDEAALAAARSWLIDTDGTRSCEVVAFTFTMCRHMRLPAFGGRYRELVVEGPRLDESFECERLRRLPDRPKL